MSKKRPGIGVIGAGLIGGLHCYSLSQIVRNNLLPMDLVHVADMDLKKAELYKQRFGFKKAGKDAQALIEDPDVDAVLILTWTSEHPALVQAAAKAGKHVFCEKPLAFTAAEARKMEKALVSRGLVNQVGLVLRQGPIWNVLKEMVKAKGLGLPVHFIFRDDQCFPIKGAHPSVWRKDPKRAGHGTLIEHSIHDLDLCEWIFGPIVSLRAETAERFGVKEIEDLARVDIEFASGMTGTLVSAWHDVLNRHSNRRLEIFYENEFLALEDEFTGPIMIQHGKGALVPVPAEEVNERFFQLRKVNDPVLQKLSLQFGILEDYLFVKSVIAGRPASPDFSAAVRAHELVDACYKSAKAGGKRVSVVKKIGKES